MLTLNTKLNHHKELFPQPNRIHLLLQGENGKLVNCEEKEKIFAQNFQVSLLLFLECVSQVSSEALWRKYDEMHENSSSIKRLNISE